MIDIHSKYDNMHKNGIFYALIYFNDHVKSCINFMLLINLFGVNVVYTVVSSYP